MNYKLDLLVKGILRILDFLFFAEPDATESTLRDVEHERASSTGFVEFLHHVLELMRLEYPLANDVIVLFVGSDDRGAHLDSDIVERAPPSLLFN